MNERLRPWFVLIAASLSGFLICTDFTIVTTCLPQIQETFHASNKSLQWVVTGFGISFCALMTPYGKIGDNLGRRGVFYTTISFFLIASILAGMAGSMHMLVIMRFFQGFFGAAIFPVSTSIILDAFPEEQHNRALALSGSIWGVGLAAGPVLGGVISHIANWRWIFYVNIPVIAFILLLALPSIQPSKLDHKEPIDFLGSFLLVLALAGLLIYLNEGGVYGWRSPVLLAALAAGVLSAAAFWVHEHKITYPLIVFSTFKDHQFLQGCTLFFATIVTAWAVTLIMPLYLHNLLHYNGFQIGKTLGVMTLMTALSPTLTGLLFHKSPKFTPHLAFLMAVLGLLALASLGALVSMTLLFIAFILYGLAWGTGNALPIPIAVSGKTTQAGLLTGMMLTLGNMGGVIALSLSSFFLWHHAHRVFSAQVAQALPRMNSSMLQQVHAWMKAPDAHQVWLHGLPHAQQSLLQGLYKHAFTLGYRWTMVGLAAFAALCWCVFLIEQRKAARRDQIPTS